jgi:SAM-dependent methyltransferase
MTFQDNCPLCNTPTTQTLLFYNRFPYFTVPVSKAGKTEILKRYSSEQLVDPLRVKSCSSCCHCYLETLPDQEIIDFLYSKYYSYPSPLKGYFRPERDNKFLEFIGKSTSLLSKEKRTNVLEVGCYDGYILHHLQQQGYTVTGCDPSEGAEIGKEYGINIIREFFNAEAFLKKNQTSDIVISRHFIEHVTHPREWIKELKTTLSPNGLLILETPNIQFNLEKGVPEVFSLQHLQGFSSVSLEYALRKEGLKVIAMEQTPDNLIAIAKEEVTETAISIQNWNQITSNFNNEISKKKEKIKQTIKPYLEKGKTIGLWGAGGFTLAMLTFYEFPLHSVDFIIDSAPNKRGMEYLNYSTPIISPMEALQNKPDIIIITSMYSQSIKEEILKMNFQAFILTIFPEISVSKS